MIKRDTPDPVDVHVGQRLRMARTMKELSQGYIGEAVGLTFQQVQKYEKGANRIGASRLVQFAVLLEKPVEWFFEGAPGYTLSKPSQRADVTTSFFSLPYAMDVANDYVAIPHNFDRGIVRDVARALASRP